MKIKLSSLNYWRLVLLISILIKSQLTFGQGNKVHHYGEVTADEKARQDLQIELGEATQEYSRLMLEGNISHPGEPGFVTDDKEVINNIISKNEDLLNRINSTAGLRAAATRIKTIQSQLGNESIDELGLIIDAARKNIRNGEIRLQEIRDKEEKDVQVQKEHETMVAGMESEIKTLKEQNQSVTKQLEENNKNQKSVDDFLSSQKKSSTTGDFLSNDNKQSTGDFLSGSNDNEDFLSAKEKNNARIDSKDGKQGVIDDKGNILIPYKEWIIVEYKNGIAKVRINLEWYTGDEVMYAPSANGFYSAVVYKTGFVDKTGEFLDGYHIASSGKFKHSGGYIILSRGDDTRTNAERHRDEEKLIKKGRLNKEREISKGQQWELETIRKYQ